MKYSLRYTHTFKRQRSFLVKRGYDVSELDGVIVMLANDERLPAKHRDHALKGKRKGQRECHIRPDWLLVYEKDGKELTLLLCETGTHSDLFDD